MPAGLRYAGWMDIRPAHKLLQLNIMDARRRIPLQLAAAFIALLCACSPAGSAGSERLATGSLLIDSTGVHVDVSGPLTMDGEETASAESYFHIGSNTKAMTTTMIAMLVEEGLLGWDTTVGEVWPQHAAEMHEQLRSVSLHDLLAHRSGIQSFTAGGEWKSVPPMVGDARQQRIAFSQWLLEQEPAGQRGLYIYSNAGYAVASAMVEELSGIGWEELMQARLFDPLGMQVQFGWPLDHDAAQPQGYLRKLGMLMPYGSEQGYDLPQQIAPAGDLSMPLGDYAKFLKLHMDGLAGEPRLLSAETFAFLHEPVGHYACGWIVLEREGKDGVMQKVSTHDGSAGTFYLSARILHGQGVAMAAVVNAGGDPSRELVNRMMDELLPADSPAESEAAPGTETPAAEDAQSAAEAAD